MKPASLPVEIAGQALVLSSLRAAFDPALRCLFVADAHFGKDAVFRARGVPVPVGSTADNLMRLDILIAEFEPATLVFLGDLLHAREAHADETLNALHVWRARHAALRVVLVEGNHDRHAGALPITLDVDYVQEPGAWDRGHCVITRRTSKVLTHSPAICIPSIESQRATTPFACRAFVSARNMAYCPRSAALPEVRATTAAPAEKESF